MSHILLHRFNGEPLFVGKAHIRSFGDRWICIGEREDVAVAESIKEIAQALNLMTYELEPSPAPVPATPEQGWGAIYSAEIAESADPVVRLANSIVYHCAIVTPRTKDDPGLFSDQTYVEAVRDAVMKIRVLLPLPASPNVATTQGTLEGAK